MRQWLAISHDGVSHNILPKYRLLDSLVIECWLRVREVPDSIPSQGPRHTKYVIKSVPFLMFSAKLLSQDREINAMDFFDFFCYG